MTWNYFQVFLLVIDDLYTFRLRPIRSNSETLKSSVNSVRYYHFILLYINAPVEHMQTAKKLYLDNSVAEFSIRRPILLVNARINDFS